MGVPTSGAADLYRRFWAQTARWLTGLKDQPPSGDVFIAYTSRDYYEPGQEAVLFARVRLEQDASEDADVIASVRTPSGNRINMPLAYVGGTSGLYRTMLDLDEPGTYTAEVSGKRGDQLLGEDKATFYLGEPHREFDRVAMNEPLLRAVAFESAGAFYTPEEAGGIPDDFVAAVSEEVRFVEKRFARMPALYVLMVVCATLEWLLRKRRGLL
ncbi:MAG TPA: hypothetical protein ENN80_03750 [Candidatus Hydrogenedentes bacterium]|nr:hypothetical protein [Candidatus Hydrogenedentota bacterium]